MLYVKGFVLWLLVLLGLTWNRGAELPVPLAEPVLPAADSGKYPQNYFAPPIDLPLTLAGNFGEPRRGHFHTGLDFRTNSEEGHAVFASADGYISRINVSASGYGNALFITHPNGYVTVYGHLREFIPKLMERLRKEQYAKKQFAADIFLKPDEFTFKQGDTIAFSGSTGASGGPHLHFEIRDASERPINPMLFGFKITDDKHTVVKAIKIYAMDSLKYRSEGLKLKLDGKDSSYHVPGDVVKVNATHVGVAINVYDLINLTDNYIGVYHIKMYDEGHLIYEYKMDRMSFSDTRYVLSQLDYPEFMSDRLNMFNKCFVEPGNKCPVYNNIRDRGIIDLSNGRIHDEKMEVSDFTGNVSTIRFRLFYDGRVAAFKPADLNYRQIFYPFSENEFLFPDIRLKMPAHSLFDTVYFNYSLALSTEAGIYSKIHHVGNTTAQVFQWFTIAIKAEKLNAKFRPKAVIVYKDADGTEVSRGGRYDSGFVMAKAREFGIYYIKIDTTPPTISAANFVPGKNIKPGQKLIFKISDNLSGIAGFDTYLDGEWEVSDYDAKSYSLIYNPGKNIAPGAHSLKVVVRDERNNSSEYTVSIRI